MVLTKKWHIFGASQFLPFIDSEQNFVSLLEILKCTKNDFYMLKFDFESDMRACVRLYMYVHM